MPVINHHARLYDEAIPRIYFYVTTKELREAQLKLDQLCPNLWSAKPVKDEAAGAAPEGDAKRYGFWIDPQIDSGLVADCLDSVGATPEPR
jgi:hypothetical protein